MLNLVSSFGRYKIYAEGYALSVSLKYILSCNSVALIISQQYKDFFSRGLIPTKNYFPISSADLCRSIKSVVDWGNANPTEVWLNLSVLFVCDIYFLSASIGTKPPYLSYNGFLFLSSFLHPFQI